MTEYIPVSTRVGIGSTDYTTPTAIVLSSFSIVEPNISSSGDHQRYWEWTATSDGAVRVDTDLSMPGPNAYENSYVELVVYAGPTYQRQDILVDDVGPTSSIRFPGTTGGGSVVVRAGETYLFQVTPDSTFGVYQWGPVLRMSALRSADDFPWISALHDRDDNYVQLPSGNTARGLPDESWMTECVRSGTGRESDFLIQEVLNGVWPGSAAGCALAHARWGDIGHILWNGSWTDPDDTSEPTCPTLVPGLRDRDHWGAHVTYSYSDHTGFPFVSDAVEIGFTIGAIGIWLHPVKDHATPQGWLNIPVPADYGYPAASGLIWESDKPTLWKAEVTDAAGVLGGDPLVRYAMGYDMIPGFASGTWNQFDKGNIPGAPVTPPAWVDGPEYYSFQFDSEPLDIADKTWHPLDIPADGFESLTVDHLNDTYDYAAVAGPVEAFDQPVTVDRGTSIGLLVRAYVRAPRFKLVSGPPIETPVLTVTGGPQVQRQHFEPIPPG